MTAAAVLWISHRRLEKKLKCTNKLRSKSGDVWQNEGLLSESCQPGTVRPKKTYTSLLELELEKARQNIWSLAVNS